MITELKRKFSMISIRILVATLIIQQFDDYEILQELNDHRFSMKIFNDFDQNSGGQPNYSTI